MDNPTQTVSEYQIAIPTVSNKRKHTLLSLPDEPSENGLLALRNKNFSMTLEVNKNLKNIESALNKIYVLNQKIEESNYTIDQYTIHLYNYQQELTEKKEQQFDTKIQQVRVTEQKAKKARTKLNQIKRLRNSNQIEGAQELLSIRDSN